MGTKCFHDIQIVDSQQVTHDPQESQIVANKFKTSDKKTVQTNNNQNKQFSNKETTYINNPNNNNIPINYHSNNNDNKDNSNTLKNQQNINKNNYESNNNSNIKETQSNKNSMNVTGLERKGAKQKNIAIANNKDKADISEGYEKSVLKVEKKHNRNNEDEELIENCLVKHFFMRGLERQARKEIIREMSLVSVKENTFIFKQDGIGSYFYILKQGTVEFFATNDKNRQIINVGESFGELALLHGAPRSQNALAVTDCYLWVMERRNFRKIVEHITKLNYEENKNFVESIPILANIDNAQKSILCNGLYKETFEAGDYIVREGEQAHCLYIVKDGEVNCSKNGKIVRTLVKGDNFGERSILVESTRSLDVIAKSKCICYSISEGTLKSIMGANFRTNLYLNFIKSSFHKSKIFGKFNLAFLDKAFQLFHPINLKKDEIAYKNGFIKSSKIIVIVDGNLINSTTKKVIGNRGDILFEKELFDDLKEKIDYDLIPKPDCLLVEADTEKFKNILGGNFKKLMAQNNIIESLAQVQIFKNLTLKKLENLVQAIGEESFKNGENVMTQGEEGNKFYILKSGKVDIFVNDKYIRTLNERECFGERALFFHEKRSATIKAVGNVTVFYISSIDFENIIEGNMKEHLMNRLYLQDNTVELKDLIYISPLGSGNYGTVYLVKNKKNKFNYALKSISRKQIDGEQLHKNLDLERSILLQIDHPFIVKLVKTLKDTRFLYFLMEYIKGNELFDVIRDIGLLNKAQTQFYGASLMLAVDYLHNRKFIFRDIKPENCMVISTGYIKIIDFGTAKKIEDRTNTIIGTPHYMAPEVILGEGYSFQVDIWSIAICMYEFMCGGVPFGENAEDPMDVYLAIINDKMTFPNFCRDHDFKLLMQQMLTKNPMRRMSKFSQVKSHIWFSNFNWEDLISLNMPAPYKQIQKKDPVNKENILFVDYVKGVNDNPENKEIEVDPKNKEEYDEWWNNY